MHTRSLGLGRVSLDHGLLQQGESSGAKRPMIRCSPHRTATAAGPTGPTASSQQSAPSTAGLRGMTMEQLRTVRAHRVEAIAHDRRDVADLARIPGVFDAEVDGERVCCTVRGSVRPLLAWLSAGDV